MTYRRSDYVTERSRMVQGPLDDALPPLVPGWRRWAHIALLMALAVVWGIYL